MGPTDPDNEPCPQPSSDKRLTTLDLGHGGSPSPLLSLWN